ncbi:MAG: ImmA/IrrE family metallo-endopeptidase [Acidimicrobiales bacterium]|nr:ImmA/IrrE family metallo-endopeptidase [Acidimicrobiales bacterium]
MTSDLTPTGPVIPDRIRSARQLRGLTQREVVDSMPERHRVTPAALSQLESGATSPSPGTVRGLAVALDVPEAFFRARWRDDDLLEGRAPTFFRHLRSTAKRDRMQAEAVAGLVFDLVGLLKADVRLPEVDVPNADVGMDADADEVIEAALLVRHAWGLDDRPVDNVVRLIERHGVPVVRLHLGKAKIDAFSVSSHERPVVVLTDDKWAYARSRFDAAHELGHLVMHRDHQPGSMLLEKQAHIFASELLMPTEVAAEVLPTRMDNSGWRQLASLKQEWGMSMAALLMKCRAVGKISPSAYVNAMKAMSARGWRQTEPGDRELGPPERPVLLKRAVRRAAEELDLEPDEYLRLSGLPVDDCRELLVHQRPAVDL